MLLVEDADERDEEKINSVENKSKITMTLSTSKEIC